MRIFSKLVGLCVLPVVLLVAGYGWESSPVAAASAQQSQQKDYKTRNEVEAPFDPVVGLLGQSSEAAARKSAGCLSSGCHVGAERMHESPAVRLGCVDCHGGNADTSDKRAAHVFPRNKKLFSGTAGPVRAYADWLKEGAEFVRFSNPGDLRVLDQTCGSSGCHADISLRVRKSMMTHGGFLWGAALYNNGGYPWKDSEFGESYALDGSPQRIYTIPPPTPEETLMKGILPFLSPLPQWGVAQPGNILRVFERGGQRIVEVGVPNPEEEPGRPDKNLSFRGLGTGNRTDPVYLGLQKTCLLDPLLHMPGTNDHAGDYRHSGCTSCHVIYANDRSPVHSGSYAQYGNRGYTQNPDPTIPRQESGHPIRHRLTRAIPTSQCIGCHVHPGGNMVTTYLGYLWWDNESDGDLMYPSTPYKHSAQRIDEIQDFNPEGSALRGKWSDPEFLANLTDLNPQLEHSQFADFHGHGWVYRAVFKRDRKGNLLDEEDRIVPFDDPDKFEKAVHLKDIHMERGLHCIDCHFEQDSHGSGLIYSEPRAAVEIDCKDCHGSVRARTNLRTSGFAAPDGGNNLSRYRTPWGKRRFEKQGERLIQRSMVEPDVEWELVQVMDTITPGNRHYNAKSDWAKTVGKDGKWGSAGTDRLAHEEDEMTCFACHSSWITSCFGCHLSMKADTKKPNLHYEGGDTKNWTSYNYQVLRDDIFMLGIDGTVTGNRIAPVASRSAVVVSSQSGNREWLYQTQQTISAEGYSGQAMSTHVPHTVRTRETKTCTDCHVSSENDNNAIMAQLLLQGTNLVNFMGVYAYVGTGEGGFEAVQIAEREEPQAIIGSTLHADAYPEEYHKHEEDHEELKTAHHHHGHVSSLQLRGEYLYAAGGSDGLVIYDVAQIDHKGFSERMTSAPVSPIGQRLRVRTKHATAVASPSTLAVDPVRDMRPENQEQDHTLVHGFLYVTDLEEGLIVVLVATLLDGDPTNNFLERNLTYNPDGLLDGAVNIEMVGNHAYISCDRGLVILDMSSPLEPVVTKVLGAHGSWRHDP